MATLNSTTYGNYTGQTFDTTTFPTQADVANWCSMADLEIEAEATTTLSNARSTNALTAVAVKIVERIQRNAEAKRFVDEASQGWEPIPLLDREIRRQIARLFEPDEIPFGSFKLVKDRND